MRSKADKLRQEICNGRVQPQLAPLIKQHRDRSCRDNFGYRSQVEDGLGVHLRCPFVIPEVAESLRSNQRSAMSHGERGSGEGTLPDRLADDGKGPGKLRLLIVEGRTRRDEVFGCLIQESVAR